MLGKIAIMCFLALVLVNSSMAATIYGTVYDTSLKKVQNAMVEIDTNPRQFFVAQNGSYSFNVPYGFYSIKAKMLQKNTIVAYSEENISVRQEGAYVLDLILIPDIEEGVEAIGVDFDSDPIETISSDKAAFNSPLIISIVLIAALFLILYLFFRNKTGQKAGTAKNPKTGQVQGSDLDKVVEIIKKEGGRATQKDIRKEIPLSEAKISLMIAELEHKGIVQKIKKGRGNIIILKNSK
ncbi:MAG TPA: hypothetical protein VI564_07250 [Candidatus Nanoarchaeia archaeon]|nr:hypothetical protein [Candidatus Nanoarchaeia archaeon]